MRDEAGIGPGVDAHLSSQQIPRLVKVALVAADGQARALGQQVPAARGGLQQFSNRRVLLGRGERTPASMTHRDARDLRYYHSVTFTGRHAIQARTPVRIYAREHADRGQPT